MKNNEAYYNAKRKARLLKDLYAHLGTIVKITGFWDKWEENKTEELIRKEHYK